MVDIVDGEQSVIVLKILRVTVKVKVTDIREKTESVHLDSDLRLRVACWEKEKTALIVKQYNN